MRRTKRITYGAICSNTASKSSASTAHAPAASAAERAGFLVVRACDMEGVLLSVSG
jgi:hypothetical protein